MTGQVADEAAVDAVLTASRTLVAVATQSLGAAAEDTTIAQYRALVVLASRGPQRMTDLAAALDVTPSTAGRMCDRLLRKGLIRRHRARSDRRAVQVSVTAAGRGVVDQATARRRALIAGILGRLPARQQSAAASALGAFAAAAGEIPDSQWPADPHRAAGGRRNGSRRAPAAHTDDHDRQRGGGQVGRSSAVGRPGERVAAGLAGRAVHVALAVGAGSGLGAVAFRYLIYFFTWLATGHVQFGQQGRIGSSHLPWLGLGFFVVIPVIGGLLYGPLIHRYAREARGHGVPEVMIAVADQGGRIRPQVAWSRLLPPHYASGRAGRSDARARSCRSAPRWHPASASWITDAGEPDADPGRLRRGRRHRRHVQRPGHRRVLRRRADLAGAVRRDDGRGDALGDDRRPDQPRVPGECAGLRRVPAAGIGLHSTASYLLVAALAIAAALTGLAFKTVLYKTEDICNGSGETDRNGHVRRSAGPSSACCCSRSRSYMASAIRSCSRPPTAITPCGS